MQLDYLEIKENDTMLENILKFKNLIVITYVLVFILDVFCFVNIESITTSSLIFFLTFSSIILLMPKFVIKNRIFDYMTFKLLFINYCFYILCIFIFYNLILVIHSLGEYINNGIYIKYVLNNLDLIPFKDIIFFRVSNLLKIILESVIIFTPLTYFLFKTKEKLEINKKNLILIFFIPFSFELLKVLTMSGYFSMDKVLIGFFIIIFGIEVLNKCKAIRAD